MDQQPQRGPPPRLDPPISLSEVWQALGIEKSAYYRLVREGMLPRPRKFGTKWGYTMAEWNAYQILAGRWFPGPFAEDNRPKKGGKPQAATAEESSEEENEDEE